MTTTYDDGTISCGPDQVEIRSYYAPIGTKKIPYEQIKGLHRFEVRGLLTGKWRIWGTGNPRYWANLDVNRRKKKFGFVIDLGRKVSPIVTPEDPDAFESAILERTTLTGTNTQPLKGPFV